MLFWCSLLTLVLAFISRGQALSPAEHQTNAVAATSTLLGWYNQTNGLWQTTSWWNSANIITTLALLTEVNPQMEMVTKRIWNNTYYNAQMFNLHQARASPDSIGPANSSSPGQHEPTIRSFNNHNTYHKRPVRSLIGRRKVIEEWVMTPRGFQNGFYDDEAWWALAWMQVYDLSKDAEHIKAATDIFNDLVATGYNATCGGIWWNKKRNYNSAITNELFLSVAAHLANRVPENKDYYLNWAKRQWDWFQKSGLINEEWNINDGLDMSTCKNNDGVIWSYNQGAILGGLVELAKADRNNTFSYLEPAKKIAKAARIKLADNDWVLHEHREPHLGNDGYQFKGILARNIWKLYDATREPWMREFLLRNAEAVWKNSRNGTDGTIGPMWGGPYLEATAATHSSALDVLVAAAAVA